MAAASVADGLAVATGARTCDICACDAAVYAATVRSGLVICRRPACEFEAFYLYSEARLTPINPAQASDM